MSGGLKDDDDNFTAALNVGTSVEEIGMYGGEGERLWVRTGTETLQLWEWRAATLGDREGGDEAFAQWPEARATTVAAAAGSPAASLFEEVSAFRPHVNESPSLNLGYGFYPILLSILLHQCAFSLASQFYLFHFLPLNPGL